MCWWQNAIMEENPSKNEGKLAQKIARQMLAIAERHPDEGPLVRTLRNIYLDGVRFQPCLTELPPERQLSDSIIDAEVSKLLSLSEDWECIGHGYRIMFSQYFSEHIDKEPSREKEIAGFKQFIGNLPFLEQLFSFLQTFKVKNHDEYQIFVKRLLGHDFDTWQNPSIISNAIFEKCSEIAKYNLPKYGIEDALKALLEEYPSRYLETTVQPLEIYERHESKQASIGK